MSEETNLTPVEAAKRLLELSEKATKAPWTTSSPKKDEDGWFYGSIVCATSRTAKIYGVGDGGIAPEADKHFIAFARNHGPATWRALVEAEEKLTTVTKERDAAQKSACEWAARAGRAEGRYALMAEVESDRDAALARAEKAEACLAACSVAAMSNTKESIQERLKPDNPYFSASYSDVCGAVDLEVRLRDCAERLARSRARLRGEVQA